MIESFEEFIQHLRIASSGQEIESVEYLEEITKSLYTTPDLFNYILRIYESQDQEILRFIPMLRPIFRKFQIFNCQDNLPYINDTIFVVPPTFFSNLAEMNPDIIDYITNMLIENINVDQWFCLNIWSPLFGVMQKPGIIERLYEKMKQIFEECSQNYENNKLLQKGFLIFKTLSNQKSCDLTQSIDFLEFSSVFFINYFTEQNLENESLAQLTTNFIHDMTLNIRFWFDFYFNDEKCLSHFFGFINFISKFEKTNPLKSNKITILYQNIIQNLHALIYWVIYNSYRKFPEIRNQFIENYLPTLFQNLVNTVFSIEGSFPYDTYMLIPHSCLTIIGHILYYYELCTKDFESVILPQYFEQLIQLTLTYSELPEDTQNQSIVNPAIYYYSAYCQSPLTEYEPRSFSNKFIIKLFEFNPKLTVEFLLGSQPSLGLMYLMGKIAKRITKIHKSENADEKEKFQEILTGEFFEQISNKIQELLAGCNFEPDCLILKSKSLLFLSEEQNKELFDITIGILNQSEEFESESFSCELQFYFTIACRIVYSLLSFYLNPTIYDSLTEHISLIIQYSSFCYTDDALKAVTLYFSQNHDSMVQNAPLLFDLYSSTILKLSNNFLEDYQSLEKNEKTIVEKAFNCICDIFTITDVDINEQQFIDFLQYFINGRERSLTEEIAKVMTYVARYSVKGYMIYLTIYFEFCKSTKIQCVTDFFTIPFVYLIYNDQDSFLNWESRDDFINFSISNFFEFIDNESNGQDLDDSYFLSTLVCMLILTPNLLDEDTLNNLLQKCFEKLSQNDNYVLRYICFNIITSVIHVSNIIVPNEILKLLLSFLLDGCVPRESEKIRYISAIVSIKDLYPNEISEKIGEIVEILNSGQIKSEFTLCECIANDKIGINGDPPYGFVN